MKTEVIMKRDLLGNEIRQRSKSGMFSANDILTVGNKLRMEAGLPLKDLSQYFDNESTKEYIDAIKWEFLLDIEEIKISTKGRNGGTWVHPMVFIDLAMWLNPELKVKIVKWVMDELIANRNFSGDSYKEMNQALTEKFPDKVSVEFYIKLANHIANNCGITRRDKDRWQNATIYQLKMRDDMQKLITIYCDVVDDISDCINKAIRKVVEKQNSHQKTLPSE